MKTRILLFTADARVSKVIAEIARRSDWEGAASNSIHNALSLIMQDEWDVFIVDIGPRGTGFLILDALEGAADGTPIIALTEPEADYYQALALANGACEILTAPVKPVELRQAVTRLCQHGSST
jgi:DNA-binding response OmpR family regulator